VNEYSTRYSETIDEKAVTGAMEWRSQSKANKQGSEEFLSEDEGAILTHGEHQLHEHAKAEYNARLAAGVAREQARKDLPLSTYTEAYWKIDLHNLLHFLSILMNSTARLEIRSYANVIGYEILSNWLPSVWEAFIDYRLNAMPLTSMDISLIQAHFIGDTKTIIDLAAGFGWMERNEEGVLKNHRERIEFESKLRHFGLDPVWH
jgi:thymidylate synthase (FAD)